MGPGFSARPLVAVACSDLSPLVSVKSSRFKLKLSKSPEMGLLTHKTPQEQTREQSVRLGNTDLPRSP